MVVLRTIILVASTMLLIGGEAVVLFGMQADFEILVYLAVASLVHVSLMSLVLLQYRRLGYRLRRRGLPSEMAAAERARRAKLGMTDQASKTEANRMRATVRYLPIFLLVVALLLLDVVAFWASRANGDLTASFAISQTCLLGIWIGIGNTRIAIRLPVAIWHWGR